MYSKAWTMIKLELCNLYGCNVLRFSKDKKSRKKAAVMVVAWACVIAMFVLYIGALSYGFVMAGMGEVIPAYLITLSSMMIFFFGMLKAGNVIFRKEGYDMLCSLPIHQTAIVVSRFVRMYVENLLLAVVMLLPGLAVYAWMEHPSAAFYLCSFFCIIAVPFIPVAGATLIGALVTAVSARMRHKSLVTAVLSILAVLVILAGTSKISAMEEELNLVQLAEMVSVIFSMLGKLYPPAVWIGSAASSGNILVCLACFGLFFAVFIAVAAAVSIRFSFICQNLYSNLAKHNYHLGQLKKESLLISLCKRELKRYFSSSIYVTNTIIGPILGVVFSAVLLFVDPASVIKEIPLSVDINKLIPFAIGGIFCIMTTTATSISMEGKNWWLIKSLPLTTKAILDAKILMNLVLMLPFYLISELLLIIALKPNFLELLWLLIIPAAISLFSCVYGITINLHFPVFNWETEVSVVKQSASSILGGLGGFIIAILCVFGITTIPENYIDLWNGAVCIVVIAVTAVLYWKNNQTDLRKIE